MSQIIDDQVEDVRQCRTVAGIPRSRSLCRAATPPTQYSRGRSGAASRPAHPQTVAGLDLDAGTVDLLDLPMARFGAVVDRRGPCSSSPSGQVDRILKTILKSGIGPQELALRIARWRMSRRH